jgi:hypothetical protein
MNYICLANAQMLLLKVSSLKGLDLLLQAELSMGVVELFKNALLAVYEIKSKNMEPALIFYLNNRVLYYQALAYEIMQKAKSEEFKAKGTNFGLQIAYLKIAVGFLSQGESDLVKFI